MHIEGTNEPYSITYSTKWVSKTRLEVSVAYISNLIGDGTEVLFVRLVTPHSYVSAQDIALEKSQIFKVDLSAQSEEGVGAAAGSAAQYGIVTSFAIGSASNFVMGSSMEKMWSLINTCQLIFYLGLVSVYFPKHVVSFFGYLKMANMENQFLSTLTRMALVGDQEDEREALNYRYNKMGYETISLLENVSDLVALV